MDPRTRQSILAALASAQTSIDLAVSLMLGARQECSHPPDKRQDLGGMGAGPEHYYCMECKTEVGGSDVHKAPAVPSADGN